MVSDDEYLESVYEGLYQLRDSMYEYYLEVMDERAQEED